MQFSKTNILSPSQFAQLMELWNNLYPVELNDRFGLLLKENLEHQHYILELNGEVIAYSMLFTTPNNDRRFSILCSEKHQNKGLGTLLLDRMKAENDELRGWVIDHNNAKRTNGTNYRSPISFYLKNGFVILENEILKTEIIQAVLIRWKKA